ncbi:hypothetical protein DWG18_07130 [Lysobacter sp. TY2-98]|uniref:hypothetical protein n=1 Tax=Lysobacter sp. TY2-98 TaxID=2290922 RepID=UPI000E208637|nr:hypothetical protein [Lysobacter sp. TY2-98]AXK72077.1 hypothetical protein DWG18_07130 [Lysobacter sp. TY2-98]
MPTDRRPPWNKPSPKRAGPGGHLTPAQKAAAKERAEAAGRRYPNLVDNMWAMRQPKDDDRTPTS